MANEGVDLNRTWEVGFDGSALKQVVDDEAFHAILALCRLVNMLQFATLGVWGLGKSESPFSRRQRMTSFSLSCALLYAAHTQTVPALAKHYRNTPVWGEGLGAWLADPEVQSLVNDHCKPLRDTATFHFDVDPIRDRLGRLKEEWTRVMSSRGTMKGFFYYDLADTVALMAFWGDAKSESDVDMRVAELTKRAAKATKVLRDAAYDLVMSVINAEPFRFRQGEDTQEPAWVTFQVKKDGVVPPEERPPEVYEPDEGRRGETREESD
jgi:hypothetical protein